MKRVKRSRGSPSPLVRRLARWNGLGYQTLRPSAPGIAETVTFGMPGPDDPVPRMKMCLARARTPQMRIWGTQAAGIIEGTA